MRDERSMHYVVPRPGEAVFLLPSVSLKPKAKRSSNLMPPFRRIPGSCGKAIVRGQRSEVRSQRSEVRDQRAEG